jgi:hypothetical protein
MASKRVTRIACALAVVLGGRFGFGQALPQSADDALHTMSQTAGVIFTGQVAAVRRQGGSGGATGVVEIDFAVEDAIRGVSGGTYTLREWAGLWAAGDEPFRVGQRLLMLLYSPNAAGLSSPVGGMDGAIPIHGGMQASVEMAAGVAARVAAGEETAPAEAAAQAGGRVVDLSWVATSVIRPITYRDGSVAQTAELAGLIHADALSGLPVNLVETASIAVADATPASGAQGETYKTVLGMLRGWEKNDGGAR